MSAGLNYGIPGYSAARTTDERDTFWQTFGYGDAVYDGNAMIDSTATDATNTPTYALRPGLVMGKLDADGSWVDYDPDAADGSQQAQGILTVEVNLYDYIAGASADRLAGFIAIGGRIKSGSLIGLDYQARAQLSRRFHFDDDNYGGWSPWSTTLEKTAAYTVTAADNGKLIIQTGSSGSVTFTLPTIAQGLRFRFLNMDNQDMVIASAGSNDNIIGMNDVGADSITFSTSSEKIGAYVELQAIYVSISSTPTLKWLATKLSANTATLA